MNTSKEFINQLYQEKSSYAHISQAQDLANSLNTISDDIYSESERFIYELIQNADDACKNSDSGVEIYIEFTDSFVIISHTGKEFAEADIRAISSVGSSQKAKNINQTGYKGIGFKSVFGRSDLVYIKSNNFSFRFDKRYWLDKYEHQMPWQIIPIWNNDLDCELRESKSFGVYPVSTAIKYDNTSQLKQELSSLLNNTQVVLFLRNVKKIVIDSSNNFSIEKINDLESNLITVKKNKNIESQWIIKNFTGIAIPKEITNKVSKDDKTPKKLKESKFTNISFAAKIANGKLSSIENSSRIFTYLPTKISWNFPFLVNADFLTNAAREAFHMHSIWNQWLFEILAIKLFKWIAELAETQECKYQITILIPKKLNGYGNNLKAAFNTGLKSALDNIAFIPNQQDRLLKVCEACVDVTGISDLIGINSFIQYCNYKYSLKLSNSCFINKEINNIEKLNELNIAIFDLDDLKIFFDTQSYIQFIDIHTGFRLIEYLYTLYNKSNRPLINLNIKALPFVLNKGEVLIPPNNIYIPVDRDNFEFSLKELNNSFHFIHESIWQKICNNVEIKQWLQEELNIKEPNTKNIIQRTIIPNLSALSNTLQSSLQLTRYLFNAHKNGDLENDDYSSLRKINLVCKSGVRGSAFRCYLSNEYQPHTPLDKYLSKDYLLSEKYIGNSDNIKDWNNFLTRIGVQEKIKLSTVSSIERSTIERRFHSYIEYVDEQCDIDNLYHVDRHHFQDFIYIPWIEEIQNNHRFSKRFWNSIILRWNEFVSEQTQYFINHREHFKVATHFKYFVTHKECIPTTKEECERHDRVIINKEQFKIIGGSFLPVLDLEINLSEEVIEFFDFRTEITLDEYLATLSHISQQEYNKADTAKLINRIELIYDALAQFKQADEIEKISDWGKENKILAEDKKFYLPKELCFIALDHFKINIDVNRSAKLPKPNSKTIALLEKLGVILVGEENLEFEIEKKQNDSELTSRLYERFSSIALILASKNNLTWNEEFFSLTRIIDAAKFYRAKRIYISAKYKNQYIVKRKQYYSYLDGSNIYYVGNWNSPRALFSLIDNLGKLLKMNGQAKELNLLLLESFSSGLEWLVEQGYDVSLIPEEYKIETTTSVIEDTVAYSEPRIDARERSEEQKERDLKTGYLGEKYVFEQLKEFYLEKYSAFGKKIENTALGFKIDDLEVIWNNKHEESGKDYDIKIVEPHKYIDKNRLIKTIEYYVEVKSTTTEQYNIENIPFYFSHNEWNLMNRNDGNYFVARVFNAIKNPSMKLIKFQDEIN